MKNIKKIVLALTLTGVSAVSLAQTVTATAGTLDDAEAKISSQAQQVGKTYRIVEASTKNCVHMTAVLEK